MGKRSSRHNPIIADGDAPRGEPTGAGETRFFDRFNFDLAGALGQQLFAHMEGDPRLIPEPLSVEALGSLEREDSQGVYELLLDGLPVYIGQAEKLRKRLTEHRRKLVGRQNIDIERVTFKCLYIDLAWIPITHEKALIKVFRKQGKSCEWNGSGFGIHDPGRNRETTNKALWGFDRIYPIRGDWPCGGIARGTHNARDLLMGIKAELPFLFRYEVDNSNSWQAGSVKYNELTIDVPKEGMAADALLREIVDHLPGGWQFTAFPSHMILYEEKRNYKHADECYRRGKTKA